MLFGSARWGPWECLRDAGYVPLLDIAFRLAEPHQRNKVLVAIYIAEEAGLASD